MGDVRRLAEAIAKLSLTDRDRLFDLLAAAGKLPPRYYPQIPHGEQMALMPASEQQSAQPDIVLVFDGGSRGNPGWGYGSYAIQRASDGAQRLERLDLGDGYTNNEAEYDTLVAALQDLIRRLEATGSDPGEFTLEVRGDSALVLNQLGGTWKAKEPRMRQRRDQCWRLLRRFGAVTLTAQPREESVRVLGH
ncbi:MAG: ribonuclease HI family protein [Anaerolineae bacterium]|jgi:ribonuclease HI